MPKSPLLHLRAMTRVQMIVVGIYGWLLLGGLAWYTVDGLHLGWKAAVIHALTFIGGARLADMLLVPVIKRATVRRISRTAREMRLLRDEHRKDPAADRKLTQVIDQMDQLAAKAKTL